MQAKLYQYTVCPFCCKVRAILDYKQVPYEAIEVHPLKKKEISFSKDYRKVPIYISSPRKQIVDSTPIMRFIDQEFPESPVFEQEESSRKLEEKWLNWADEQLVRALPPLIYQSWDEAVQAFDYITQEGKFNWLDKQLIKYSGAFVMRMVANKKAKEYGINDRSMHVRQLLKQWADALGDEDFLGKTKPNAADLAVFGILNSIRDLPAFKLVENEAKVALWFDRVEGLCQQTEKAA